MIDHWHLQDLIEITPEGPNLLLDHLYTDEMFVIG